VASTALPDLRDLRKIPRRYPDEVAYLLRASRWLGSHVWPGRAAYARTLRRGLRGERVDVPVPGLPASADGLRIVQLSDIHGGPFLDEASLEPVVALARSFEPHLLAITGDFITRQMQDVYGLGHAFARIDAPLGKFAVFGNHDYRHRRECHIAAALRRQGVRTLRNEGLTLEWGGARIALAGLEDIEESKGADLVATTKGFRGDEHARVLLCHHPDVVDVLPPGMFHLVLSGHSHGGQIVLPGFGSLGRKWMPKRLAGQFPLKGGGVLHVNRGVGVLVAPFRVGAAPEVTCLTLRRAEA
jgi:predicted MPP superfamily phosphohydrolase